MNCYYLTHSSRQNQRSQTTIRDEDGKLIVQEHISRLEISVNYRWFTDLVQIPKTQFSVRNMI